MIVFPSPPLPPYPGGCVTEPAFWALDFYTKWRADVQLGGQTQQDVVVLDTLKAALRDPAQFGVSRAEAESARDRFIEQAGQSLEREGGDRTWLAKEFGAA